MCGFKLPLIQVEGADSDGGATRVCFDWATSRSAQEADDVAVVLHEF